MINPATESETSTPDEICRYFYKSMQKYRYRWTLHDFSLGNFAHEEEYLTSPNFPTREASDYKWQLHLQASKEWDQSEKSEISVHLQLVQAPSGYFTSEARVKAECFVEINYGDLFERKAPGKCRWFELNKYKKVWEETDVWPLPKADDDDTFTVDVYLKVMPNENNEIKKVVTLPSKKAPMAIAFK